MLNMSVVDGKCFRRIHLQSRFIVSDGLFQIGLFCALDTINVCQAQRVLCSSRVGMEPILLIHIHSSLKAGDSSFYVGMSLSIDTSPISIPQIALCMRPLHRKCLTRVDSQSRSMTSDGSLQILPLLPFGTPSV